MDLLVTSQQALCGLGPTGMWNPGVYIGEPGVFVRDSLMPECIRPLGEEFDPDDAFDVFQAVFPGDDEADGGTILFWEGLPIDPCGQEAEFIHRLVYSQGLMVGPWIMWIGRKPGGFFWALEGDETHKLCLVRDAEFFTELPQWDPCPRDSHCPSFNAAEAVDPFLRSNKLLEIINPIGSWLFDESFDLDGPRGNLERANELMHFPFVEREFVKIVPSPNQFLLAEGATSFAEFGVFPGKRGL